MSIRFFNVNICVAVVATVFRAHSNFSSPKCRHGINWCMQWKKVWKKYRNQTHNQKVPSMEFWNFCILVMVFFSSWLRWLVASGCKLVLVCRRNVVRRQRHNEGEEEEEKTIRFKWKCQFRKEVSEIAENQQSSTHRNYRKHMNSSGAIGIVSVSEWVPQKSKAKKKKEKKKSQHTKCLRHRVSTVYEQST